ncbi:MAG: YebC/PmpR family DNA-binding transcriptional regulator, partial [Flavobacteriaceae bacterium]|nr:YebC/PmpR family DNA-binding transcriptional regulator [Flavobacteriaceae bacterium]
KSESEISITAKFENFGSLQKELERRKFDIISSEFEREAITLKDLSEDEIIKVEKLINMIDEDDDVQNVYHNMKSDN